MLERFLIALFFVSAAPQFQLRDTEGSTHTSAEWAGRNGRGCNGRGCISVAAIVVAAMITAGKALYARGRPLRRDVPRRAR